MKIKIGDIVRLRTVIANKEQVRDWRVFKYDDWGAGDTMPFAAHEIGTPEDTNDCIWLTEFGYCDVRAFLEDGMICETTHINGEPIPVDSKQRGVLHA